jgi:hypothetical protein
LVATHRLHHDSEEFAQRLRDYFHIENVDARSVALTQDRVDEYALPIGGSIDAKDDVNKETFRAAYGEDIYEVEALEPSDLVEIVERAIEQMIDIDAYNDEIERERS